MAASRVTELRCSGFSWQCFLLLLLTGSRALAQQSGGMCDLPGSRTESIFPAGGPLSHQGCLRDFLILITTVKFSSNIAISVYIECLLYVFFRNFNNLLNLII